MENCEKVVFHSKKERKMSMRKRIVRQVIAMVLCVCMALGLFDGIPVVKEYVRTSTEAEAADGNTLASVAESEYNSHRGKK